MKHQVPEAVKKQRSEALRDIGRRKNFDYRKKFAGFDVQVVVEGKIDTFTGCFTGFTDNYIRMIIFGAKAEHIGKNIKVRIIKP